MNHAATAELWPSLKGFKFESGGTLKFLRERSQQNRPREMEMNRSRTSQSPGFRPVSLMKPSGNLRKVWQRNSASWILDSMEKTHTHKLFSLPQFNLKRWSISLRRHFPNVSRSISLIYLWVYCFVWSSFSIAIPRSSPKKKTKLKRKTYHQLQMWFILICNGVKKQLTKKTLPAQSGEKTNNNVGKQTGKQKANYWVRRLISLDRFWRWE